MNKQRKVVITTTYNEMGIIIDTKVEELGTSAQPEPCEDAVSRKAVIEITAETGALETQYRVKRLPPVTPKQRTGHWIPVGVVEVVGGESAMWGSAVAYHKCSKCDGQALKDDFDEEELSDFCPHCGAKMEGVSNEYS